MEALRLLGAGIRRTGEELIVTGTAGTLHAPAQEIFLGNNGTALRFLCSLVSLGEGKFVLTGSRRLCERPVGPLLEALAVLGVKTESRESKGYPPVTIYGGGLAGGAVTFTDTESSQYISSLLLSAPYARGDVTITIAGRAVSEPYIELTRRVMADFGVEVQRPAERVLRVSAGQRYRPAAYSIAGDASSATYFFLAAALCGGEVRVLGLEGDSGQADLSFLELLARVGCRVARDEETVTVTGLGLTPGDLTVDMAGMPDAVPSLAVLAAFRPGRTQIRGAAHLRVKESDRLAALAAELNRIGAAAAETADGLIIEGGRPLRGAEIETYDDHRIAMSFAVAGLALPGIAICNPGCVAKSFPGFWEELAHLQAH